MPSLPRKLTATFRRLIRAAAPAGETVDPPAALNFTAAATIEAAAADGDGEKSKKPRRFSLLAYNGGEMKLPGWYYPVVVDLAGLDIGNQKLPVLLQHSAEVGDIVGQTDKITVSQRRLTMAGEILGKSDRVQAVLELHDAGFQWQASIGAIPLSLEEVDAGGTAKANGQTFKGPLVIARQSQLREVSFVPMGADSDTSARIAAHQQSANHGAKKMGFNEWLKARGFDPETLTPEQTAPLRAAYDAEIAAAGSPQPGDQTDSSAAGSAGGGSAPPIQAAGTQQPGDQAGDQPTPTAAIRAEAAAELDRIHQIGQIEGITPEIQAQAVRDGWDLTRTELAILRAARPSGPAIHANGEPATPQAIEAALCISAGISQERIQGWYPDQVLEAAAARELRGFGLHSLIYATLAAAGRPVRPGQITDTTIRAALEADREITASAGFSTVTLTGILGAVANKALADSFLAVDAVAARIAGSTEAANFQQFTRYRLAMSGDMEEVGDDGELKHASLEEGSYANQVKTYGKMIALNRQQIINDDLGAFLNIPRLLGRKAALAREKITFTALLANAGSFFAAGNNNYQSGATTALSIAALTAAEILFMNQTDEASDPVGIIPAILLVPPALRVTAQQLYADLKVNETTTANSAKPNSNPHAGKFRPECSPFLSNSNLTGNSTKAWYLLADPADVPCIELAYLRGQTMPTIEQGETDFNTLGVQWRAYWDLGVTLAEQRAGVKSKGEA